MKDLPKRKQGNPIAKWHHPHKQGGGGDKLDSATRHYIAMGRAIEHGTYKNEEDLRQALVANIIEAQDGNEYKYDIDSLKLNSTNCNLNVKQLHQLQLLVHNGKISWDNTLSQIEVMQGYLGYDNQDMVSALREIYYENALDYFIKDAKLIGQDFYAVQGDQKWHIRMQTPFFC